MDSHQDWNDKKGKRLEAAPGSGAVFLETTFLNTGTVEVPVMPPILGLGKVPWSRKPLAYAGEVKGQW